MSEVMIPSEESVSTGAKTNLFIVILIVLLLAGGVVMLLFSQKNRAKSTQQPDVTPLPTTIPTATPIDEDSGLIDGGMALDGSSSAVESRTIEIEAGAFYYKPATITAKRGEKITVIMTSKDMMHDFVVDELGIKAPITKGGETATFTFTPDTVGTFEYYCSVGQHRKNGQVGTLIVTE